MSKQPILQQAVEQRNQEIFDYQVNIDNYRIAIALASKDPDLTDFTKQLNDLLRSSIIEQKKSQIMLDVALIQLKELEDAVPKD